MEILSSAFKDGKKIPIQYVMPGAGGKNISVPLSWKNTPLGSVELRNSFGDTGYGGPQPPKGTGDRPYVFTL